MNDKERYAQKLRNQIAENNCCGDPAHCNREYCQLRDKEWATTTFELGGWNWLKTLLGFDKQEKPKS